MAKQGSVAPKERVNIAYKPATSGAREDVEIPLKILMMGDFTGRPDERPVEERAPIRVDKDTFTKVLAEQKLKIDVAVPDRLSDDGGDLAVSMQIESLADFSPDGIVNQVPELQQLLALRSALVALKGPLGNVPTFRRKLQALLADDTTRQKLMAELGLDKTAADGNE